MKNIGLSILALFAFAACAQAGRAQTGSGATPTAPLPAVRTAGVEHGSPVTVAVWPSPDDAASLVVAAAGIAGLEFYSPDGKRVGNSDIIDAGMLVTVPDVQVAGRQQALIIAYDNATSSLRGYSLQRDTLAVTPVMPEPIAIADELTGLCHYRSRLAGRDYLYAITDGGMIHHYELYESGSGVGGRLLRSIPSGKGSGFCAVDPRDGLLYVSEESTGIWRLGAEPERDTTREPVDMREPFGSLSDDLKGIAIYPVSNTLSYLVVADVAAEHLAIYALPDGRRVGTVTVDGVLEPEGIAASALTLGGAFPGGLLAVADEDDSAGRPDVKLVAWQALATAAGLDVATPGATVAEPVAVVRPVRQTDVMPNFGDAADDPAIWVHPGDPLQSIVIGTNKQSGLHVFDLDGNTLQVLADGRMNNVDLRDGFPLGGETVTLVTASNRSNDSIAAYRIDAASRELRAVADGVLETGFADPYGACMYRSAKSNEFFVFVNEGGDGTFRQWRLFDNGSGKVAIELVREFAVGSQAEGCVADDETGQLYVAEEDGGLWKYSAEPDGGADRQMIDTVGDEGRLTADIEGVALVIGDDGRGFLVVSNQGADNYAVYRREGNNDWIGLFHIVANAADGIDGASETDGLDVTGVSLGSAFPAGLLVVQDGRNIAPEQPQNFKYVSWADVLAALGVE